MYALTTTIQYIRRKHNERGLEERESGITIGGRIVKNLRYADDCDDVDNGLDNTCEVIRQETVLVSTPETDYIIYD